MAAKRGTSQAQSYTKQSTLDAKLLAYCASATGALLAAAPAADASVVYSGVKNLAIGKNSTVYVDLDNNGINDGHIVNRFQSHSPPMDFSQIAGLAVIGEGTSSYFNFPANLPVGSIISTDKNWALGGTLHFAEVFAGLIEAGNFANAAGYIGVRFRVDSSMHYGWIKYGSSTLWNRTKVEIYGTIYDWAYESTPDTQITAGQMPDPTTTTTTSIPVPFTYTVANSQVTIRGYTGPGGVVAIPATINGLPVVGIYSGAFSYKTTITGITIPDGITSIGGNAFQGCTGLTSVVIPGSVTSIGGGAFSGCAGLASVTIESGVQSIGMYAFTYCSGLTSVNIPASVTNIGLGAFAGCGKLLTALFSGNAPAMAGSVFANCASGFTVIYLTGATGFTNPWHTYPAVEYTDIDQDGIAGAVDNCPAVYNPQQLDANGNGIGDCCEPAPGCGGCGQPACDTVCSQ